MNFTLLALSGIIFTGIAILLFIKRRKKNHSTSLISDVKNIYVIRTHLWNDYVETVFLKMQQQLGAANVFLMFDETRGPINQPHIKWNDTTGVAEGPAIITVNEEDCKRINQLHMVGERTGSANRVEAQICSCYKAIRKEYDYLWFIEYDVYSNDYKQALGKFDHIAADMLTKGTANNKQKAFRTSKQNKNWFWWNSLVGDISKTPLQDQRGCFFPINRFSKRFLETLEANLSKSSGYCEVYFPTLCHISGLTLETMPLSTFAEFRYRPEITGEEFKKIKTTDYRLYHPVKEIQLHGKVDQLKQPVINADLNA
jgi:hypothetical protein